MFTVQQVNRMLWACTTQGVKHMSNKTTGNTGKGAMAKAVTAVAAIGAAMADGAKAQGIIETVPVAAQPTGSNINKYVALSVAPSVVKVGNDELPVTNKRALAVALYLVV